MSQTLNLGCGEATMPDATNVDIEPLDGVDEVVDLGETPWPWESASADRIVAHHVFEHLPRPIDALQEAVRVLAPGGYLQLTYPIGHTRFEDPTHRQFWNWNTAAAIAGERKHEHEYVEGLRLYAREFDIDVSGRLARWYTHARLSYSGPGPWLSQVPGLYGDVTATYRREE